MRGLVLGNADYYRHMTDEGWQLQAGLWGAGWQIAGRGLAIDSVNVPEILRTVQPDAVFVQDPRDWDSFSTGCFDKSVCFQGIEVLNVFPGRVMTVVKDAGTLVDYQRTYAERIGSDAIIHYYARESIVPLSPWLERYELVRTYHTVDPTLCKQIDLGRPRKRGIVSGAVSDVYPLRKMVFAAADRLGVDRLPHPGYHNRGAHTPRYLETLAGYKVHVATASRYGFALRKIIESVAMGCIPVTNLPACDVLPEIDEALVRVSDSITPAELKAVIDEAEQSWNLERALEYSRRAIRYYDYRRMGRQLSVSLIGRLAA